MAQFRFSAQVIGRSSGRSATGAAAYRAGEKIVDDRTGLTFDYANRGGVLHTEILTPENAPDWMQDRSQLWNGVEAAEKRKDAQLCREVQLSLPHELTFEQNRAMVQAYVQEHFVSRGMVADVAIHAPSLDGDERNFHAHVMLTMRATTGEGFGAKVRAWNDRENTEQWREGWAAIQNRTFERLGLAVRVDHRSYARQGEDKEPTQHLGPTASQMERRGQPSRIGDANRKIRVFGKQREGLRRELDRIERSIKIEQGRTVYSLRGTRPIERPFNWAARQGVKAAAERLKAATADARAALKSQHAEARAERRAELARYYAERRAIKAELNAPYRAALEGIWNKPAADGLAVVKSTGLAIRPEVERMAMRLNEQAGQFRQNETTWRGRLENARTLAGDNAGLWQVMRLAMNGSERQRLFNAEQRAQQATVKSPDPPKGPPTAKTPEPQHVLATRKTEEIKAERFAVMDAHQKQTRAGAEAIKERHAAELAKESEQRAGLTAETKEQWREFRNAYGLTPDPSRPFNRSADPREADWKAYESGRGQQADAEKGKQADPRNWGASPQEWRAYFNQREAKEDRERAERQEKTPDTSNVFQEAVPWRVDPIHEGKERLLILRERAAARAAEKGREADHSAEGHDSTPAASETFHGASTAPESPPETNPAPATAEAGNEGQTWTAAEVARFQAIKADRAAERSQPQEHDPGRSI